MCRARQHRSRHDTGPTLDARSISRSTPQYEVAAYEWLNERIGGIPVILEAYGPSYQEYTRVSMNTGLPTVLGWDYHVFQRAHSHADIDKRKADIKMIYTSDNREQVRAALERYHVALVYVGADRTADVRRREPGTFKRWSDLLTPVYENAGVTIFAVNGKFTGAIPVTTIEEVPQVTTEEAAPAAAGRAGRFHQPRGVAVDRTGAVYGATSATTASRN